MQTKKALLSLSKNYLSLLLALFVAAPNFPYPVSAENLPIHYLSAEFNPVLQAGMILVIETISIARGKIEQQTTVPILSDEIVSIPGLGVLEISGRKLSDAEKAIQQLAGANFRVGLMMGNVQTVQVLGRVQKPGNYPGYMKMSYLIAEAMDRSPGGNFRVSFFNGANRRLLNLRYEEIVKGKNNPIVPPGSILYFPPTASSIFGEMTEKQINLAYLIVITLGALGITAITRN